MITRPRRLRQNPVLRKMVRETRMDASSLIYPMFVREGSGIKEEIPAMEGQYRYTTDTMLYALEDLEKAGVRSRNTKMSAEVRLMRKMALYSVYCVRRERISRKCI